MLRLHGPSRYWICCNFWLRCSCCCCFAWKKSPTGACVHKRCIPSKSGCHTLSGVRCDSVEGHGRFAAEYTSPDTLPGLFGLLGRCTSVSRDPSPPRGHHSPHVGHSHGYQGGSARGSHTHLLRRLLRVGRSSSRVGGGDRHIGRHIGRHIHDLLASARLFLARSLCPGLSLCSGCRLCSGSAAPHHHERICRCCHACKSPV